ncbi:alpha/beta fold hydrolase [Algimonas porphyrae]|uniref:Hydrolase n=2 Tax=Algimonas porphyrae TaxID=1128113 RepID=A0ABQ5V3Y3_9PROT|nr:alpha/beta hydrolase [Algimonas porphyrae]GLQ21380.1 hydrolase [Algimonas porphyrae]
MKIKQFGGCLTQLVMIICYGFILSSCNPAPSNAPERLRYSAPDSIEDPAIRYAQSLSDHDYKEGWFQDENIRLHFVEAGTGPLILLYHGFPSNWLSWRDQIELLAQDYRVVAVDGLGAGLSSKPQERAPYRVEALAGQIDRLTEALAPGERFVLIGHDWGAPLSFAYAQWKPERLHGVIGMSAPPLNRLLAELARSPEQQAISHYMQRFSEITREEIDSTGLAQTIAVQSYAKLQRDQQLSDEEMALFHAAVGRTDAVDGGMNWYRANIPPWDEIDDAAQWPGPDAELTGPALFIWGEEDTIFLPSIIDALLAAEPNLRIARLPDVGHWTSMDQPEQANAAILTFLEELETLP